MSYIDTARLRALADQMLDIERRRLKALADKAIGYVEYARVSQEYDEAYSKLHREAGPKTIVALLDRIDSLERTAAAAGRALREANEREAQAALAQAGQGEAVADPIGYAAVMIYALEPSDPRVVFREDEVDARDAVGALNSTYHIAPVYGFLFSPAPPPAPAVPVGYALAMRVLQSDLYARLDDTERDECDAMLKAAPPPPQQGETR